SEMLDFVDESTAVTPKEKSKRPPPPRVGKPAEEETLSLAEADMGEGAAEPGSKKAEKERKKKERQERVAHDREERAQRKAARGPGVFSATVLPALRDSFTQPKRVVGMLILVGLMVVVFLGFKARRTPAGFFWVNRYLPSKKAATAAEAKVIERGMEKLGQGDFVGAREAVGSAAQLIGILPDDEDVKAFFVLSVSELKLEYGQLGGDWDQAKRVMEKMKTQRPAQNRARGAFALASGDISRGKQTLAGLADSPNSDLESIWLYAESLI